MFQAVLRNIGRIFCTSISPINSPRFTGAVDVVIYATTRKVIKPIRLPFQIGSVTLDRNAGARSRGLDAGSGTGTKGDVPLGWGRSGLFKSPSSQKRESDDPFSDPLSPSYGSEMKGSPTKSTNGGSGTETETEWENDKKVGDMTVKHEGPQGKEVC